MAKMDLVGIMEVEKEFFWMSEAATKAAPAMLNAGAQVLIDAQKSEVAKLTKSGRSMGGLGNSIKATPIKSSGSSKYVEVYPHGADRNHTRGGVQNAEKGFVLEYGRSNMAARPWMSAANEKAADIVSAEMAKVWEAHNGSG